MKKQQPCPEELISSMTIHGFPAILSSCNVKSKLFWFFTSFAALVGLVILVTLRLQEYKSYKVYTNVESSVKQEMPFPAVTFCNSYIRFLYNSPTMRNTSLQNKKCTDQDKNKDFDNACTLFLSGLRNAIRFDYNDQPDFPASFSRPKTWVPCFTLKNDVKFKQKTPAGGLQMFLYLNTSDTTEYSQELQLHTKLRNGLEILIQNEASALFFPYPDFVLQGGTSVDIALKKIEYRRKPSPYSNCVSSHPEVERMFGKYSEDNCIALCYFKQCLEVCNDLMPFVRYLFPKMSFDHSTEKSRPCAENFFAFQFNMEACKCNAPCFEVVYEKTIHTMQWPQGNQLQQLKDAIRQSPINQSFQHLTEEDFKKNFIRLQIKFPRSIIHLMEEEALYSAGSFVSEIGGLMGLFLGASLISLVEVFFVIMAFIRNIIQRKTRIENGKQTDAGCQEQEEKD
eukprot:gene9292-10273_t